MPQPLTASPSARLSGRARVPGDKSISHRALILGALATGHTRIIGLLEAEDVMATAKAVAALGAEITRSNGAFEVRGQGVGGLRAPSSALDFGNSGTGSRLMLGVVAGHDMQVEFTGDASLRRRPMGRVLAPLTAMGLQADGEAERATFAARGARHARPPSHRLRPSCALGASEVGHPACRHACAGPHHNRRDRWRREIIPSACSPISGPRSKSRIGGSGARAVTVCGDAELHGAAISVPGDPSSAAFMIAAALISPGSDIVIESVLMNPTRSGFIETLREMGASSRCSTAA